MTETSYIYRWTKMYDSNAVPVDEERVATCLVSANVCSCQLTFREILEDFQERLRTRAHLME